MFFFRQLDYKALLPKGQQLKKLMSTLYTNQEIGLKTVQRLKFSWAKLNILIQVSQINSTCGFTSNLVYRKLSAKPKTVSKELV